MRLHRLAVRDFRGVEAREVVFADTGVTLLHGPNEAGKSSLLEALRMLLEVKATSKSQRVEAVLPAGRDVAPQVEAELTVGPYRFVYAKRFHRRPGTTVTVLQPAPQQLSGGSADDWVRGVLDAHVDGQLLAALTVLQGPAPGQPALRDSAAFAKALVTAAGAGDDRSGDDATTLYDAVAAERSRYYTATGRETAELAAARARAAAARSEHDAALAALAQVDDAVARHAMAAARLAEASDSAAAAAARLDGLAARQAEIAALRAAVVQARSASEAAAQQERVAGRELAVRRKLAARHEDARVRADRLRVVRDHALADRDVRAAELAWLNNTVEELGVVAADRRERKAQAQYAFDYAREASRYQRVHARIAAAEMLEKEEIATRERLSANVADRSALQAIAAARQDVDAAQARLRALSATIRLERLGFGDVMVDGRYLGEEPLELLAGDGTTIEVPGAVRIEIRQQGESVAASEQLKAATARLDAACGQAGASSPEDARELYEARVALELELQEIRVKLARVTGDDGVDELRGQLAESAELMADLEAATGPEELDVDPETAKRRHLSAVADELQARQEFDTARADLDQHAADLRGAETAAQVAAARLAALDETASDTAAELSADRARVSDADLITGADEAAEAARRAADVLAARTGAARAADVDGFAARLAQARQHSDAAAREEADARKVLAHTEGELASYHSQGRRDALDAAVRELAHADETLASVHARARAADLLHRTLTAHRNAQRARVQGPFQRALEDLGRTVFGDPLTVTVDDDLTIASRTVGGVTVPFESLSGGAQEQLGILSRLACARLVDPDEGAPVLIDDALGHSDHGRLAAMSKALLAAGREAQVIVFSCDAQRFAGLRGCAGVTEVALE